MNPLEALSPTIIAQLRTPENPTTIQRAKYRAITKREVLNCVSCELHHEGLHTPFSAPVGAVKMVVVTEAPEAGVRAVGPAGKLLRVLLREAGIEPSGCLFTHTVSCPPRVEGKARVPSKVETMACRPNLMAQVEAGYTPFVLLVGGRALDSFRSDLTVTNHHGNVYVWNDLYVVMPIHSPAAVLVGKSEYKRDIARDLKKWVTVMDSENPLWYIGETCYRCDSAATMWDRDGVPMCEKHYATWKGQWDKERRKWGAGYAVQLTL